LQRLLMPEVELIRVRGKDVATVISRLEHDRRVAYAEPNWIATPAAVPNDPSFGQLWALQNTGQLVNGTTGTPDADIGAAGAWDATTGSHAVTVGIADSGIDIGHPDLVANVVAGASFVKGVTDTGDDVWHGSFVAGVVGAVGNNGMGVTGVNWGVSMAPLKICDLVAVSASVPPVQCTAAAQANAYTYASQHGFPIVNASLNTTSFSQTVYNAILNAPKTLFVATAGNKALNVETTPQYPCSYTLPNILCVAATDQSDKLAAFSNWGASSVDLAAPGTNIYGVTPWTERFTDNYSEPLTDRWVTGGSGGAWQRTCGSARCYVVSNPAGTTYSNSENAWLQTAVPLPLTDFGRCQVTFRLKGVVQSPDQLIVEASTDGISWSPGGSWNGQLPNWKNAFFRIWSANDAPNAYIRFRLQTDESGTAIGVSIDDAAVRCQPAPGTYAGTEYTFSQGTSFSTAYVTGAAALMKAYRPTATVAEIRNALLAGGDPEPALVGKTVSGKRLDIGGALAALTRLKKSCPGYLHDPRHQIVGTRRADHLVGTGGKDIICGLDGKDELRGKGGKDLLLGGRGNDRLIGGRGRDVAFGGPADDRCSAEVVKSC
jgi:subtilisin family serine protease